MDKIYSIWFHYLGIGEATKFKLYNKFNCFEEIFKSSNAIYKSYGLSELQIEKINNSKVHIDKLKQELEKIYINNIQIIDIDDSNYPKNLKNISDPPMVLFVFGDIECLSKPMIAVVGARKCSEYGFEIAQRMGCELTKKGMTVVSGMALGIDEAAHKGALTVGGTAAVLGTGINVCYPKQNYDIYRKIPIKGCHISEYLPNTQAMPFQFPKRNRIISGMTLGTLVVEAAEKSGSLITADLALEYNRLVFAIPGNITSKLSSGTNYLIQQGAKLVMEVDDILDELPGYIRQNLDCDNKILGKVDSNLLDKVEIMVYDCLSWQPKEVDELITNTSITSEKINTILLKLEIKGLIQKLPGNRYMRLN